VADPAREVGSKDFIDCTLPYGAGLTVPPLKFAAATASGCFDGDNALSSAFLFVGVMARIISSTAA